MVADGQVIEAVNKMRTEVEYLTRAYTGKMKDTMGKGCSSRYEEYLKIQTGRLNGISTGV